MDAVLVAKFGHLGLRQGTWPSLGSLPRWIDWSGQRRSSFATSNLRVAPFTVIYDDRDPNKFIREEQVSPGEAEQGPRDGLLGAGALEIRLTRLLRT